jgi:DNA adenine methylase
MPTHQHGFTSPLRYPGGKGMLANFVKLVLIKNKLLDGHYAEVYAGAAGIAWSLLFDEFVAHVHINDLDQAVYSFWCAVLDEPDALCRLIYNTPITMEQWHIQKRVQAEVASHTSLELGFSTFFLNRTNWSGIIWGGVIGGKSQAGSWTLDARFNRKDLIARIQRIARYKQRISLYKCDGADFIRQILPQLPKRALIYLDPPYYVKGEGLYTHHYVHDNHAEIARLVAGNIEQPWVVSYDSAPQVIRLYQAYRSRTYDLSYSAQNRYSGSEVMFFANQLAIPDMSHPTFVRSPAVRLASVLAS